MVHLHCYCEWFYIRCKKKPLFKEIPAQQQAPVSLVLQTSSSLISIPRNHIQDKEVWQKMPLAGRLLVNCNEFMNMRTVVQTFIGVQRTKDLLSYQKTRNYQNIWLLVVRLFVHVGRWGIMLSSVAEGQGRKPVGRVNLV